MAANLLDGNSVALTSPAGARLEKRQADGRNTIVHVAEYAAPYASNFISSLQALGVCLREAGLRQVLVLPGRARRRNWIAALQAKAETALFFLPEGTLWARARELATIVRQERGLLIHTSFCPADWIGWLARLRLQAAPGFRASVPPPPLVWHYQSPPVSTGTVRFFLGPLKYRVLSRSIEHVAVSEGTLQQMTARGIPKRLCHLVRNAIDFERTTSPVTSRVQVRSELGIAPETKCLLLFGHDPERKGVDLALSAVAEVAAADPTVVLVIVGEERLRQYVCARLGASTPGWLVLARPREAAADYYQAADVFLSPSRVEGLPYAVLEALANRLPVLANDIPGLEWARGLEAVRLCPPGDPHCLTNQLRQLLAQRTEDRNPAALRAQEYVREHHSTKTWAFRMLNLYSEIIGFHNGPHPRPGLG